MNFTPEQKLPPQNAPQQAAAQRPVIDRAYFYLASALAAVFAIATITLLTVIFTTGSRSESHGTSSAKAVSEKCDSNNTYLTLGGDMKSLTFENDSSTSRGDTVLACVLTETEAPSSVASRISHTRGMDGKQTATWDGWTIYWSYMKGEGLDVTLAQE